MWIERIVVMMKVISFFPGIISSTITGYTGDYIESNQKEGDLSEEFTVTFEVYTQSSVSGLAT